jgi:TIR domain/RDD family
MAHEVFVSYSHHDKPQADAVCATLEAKQIRCWIAPRDIVPGQEWGAAIVDAIQSSRVMVLVFSSHANTSPQIRREVQLAVDAGTVLIPFRIEDVTPAQSLKYFLGTPHWLDALTPPLETHLERLAPAVTSFLAVSDPVGTSASTSTTPQSDTSSGSDRPEQAAQTRGTTTETSQIEGSRRQTQPLDGGPSVKGRAVAAAVQSGQVVSPQDRVGAALVDAIPILIAYGIAYLVVVVGTRYYSCGAGGRGWCGYYYSATVAWAGGVVASLVAAAYSIWNWGYRQGNKGSSIGKSALGYKVLSEETGQPIGTYANRITKVVGLTLAALLLSLGLYMVGISLALQLQ